MTHTHAPPVLSVPSSPQVPRWVKWCAHAIPLVLLPSSLWRVGLVLDWPAAWYGPHDWLPGEKAYVLSLSLVSEILALLALGLVRPWGERVPGWVPVLGGRTIPVRAVVIPAYTGALAVLTLFSYGMLNHLFQFVPPLNGNGVAFLDSGPGLWALRICYAPALAWGPLLVVVTRAYHLRRTRTAA